MSPTPKAAPKAPLHAADIWAFALANGALLAAGLATISRFG